MAIECSLKTRTRGNDFAISTVLVVTKTIDDDDVVRPTQRAERARDVRRFVVREYERCDLVQHLARSLAGVANHVLPEPRRAAVEREAEIVKAWACINFESVLTLKNLM